jgi:hypothetical protein
MLTRWLRLCALALLLPHLAAAEELSIGGARIDVQFASEPPSPEWRQMALQWTSKAARAVSTYYEHFPVRRYVLQISPKRGKKAGHGTTYGWDGALTTVSLGRDATAADLADDWLLTHEMVHTALPSLADRHHWLEEGTASYVEPVARARAGQITPEHAWAGFVEGMPQGLPEAGDRGLDYTHTWGRTYWGGALFCLRADVEIRRRTGNRRGLEHALRAIQSAGGNIETEWSIERTLSAGDAGTGVNVLQELYAANKSSAVPVDLDALWQRLGIVYRDGAVTFNDQAPLAAVRRSIMAREPAAH